MITNVMFDMDGVLFDSMPYHAIAWHKAMREFDLSFTETDAFMNEGRTGASTINIAMRRIHGRNATEQEIQTIYERKCEIFKAFPEPNVIEGTRDLVEKIRAEGLTAQIVTGSGQGSLLDRIETYYPNLFATELMVTAYDVAHGKPNPEPYLIALQKAQIPASQAVVIENAPLGVLSARNAGIFTIAVNTGPLPTPELQKAGANIVLSQMKDVWNVLQTYL